MMLHLSDTKARGYNKMVAFIFRFAFLRRKEGTEMNTAVINTYPKICLKHLDDIPPFVINLPVTSTGR